MDEPLITMRRIGEIHEMEEKLMNALAWRNYLWNWINKCAKNGKAELPSEEVIQMMKSGKEPPPIERFWY